MNVTNYEFAYFASSTKYKTQFQIPVDNPKLKFRPDTDFHWEMTDLLRSLPDIMMLQSLEYVYDDFRGRLFDNLAKFTPLFLHNLGGTLQSATYVLKSEQKDPWYRPISVAYLTIAGNILNANYLDLFNVTGLKGEPNESNFFLHLPKNLKVIEFNYPKNLFSAQNIQVGVKLEKTGFLGMQRTESPVFEQESLNQQQQRIRNLYLKLIEK